MSRAFRIARAPAAALAVAAALIAGPGAAQQQKSPPVGFTVTVQAVDDLKSVFATVRSKDRIEARVRTPGTVVTLKVEEGRLVEPGQLLALVADPKIALKLRALDAQIVGIESRLANARAELERAEQLKQRGVTSQARVDQLKTAFDVASNELKSARAERLVAEEQVTEGQVLAPAAGRILKVPVTTGSVVLPGESIATIAANQYILRLELPERHARFMKKGDAVRLGERGLGQGPAGSGPARAGRIIQVYPELQGGRVIADAEVDDLGNFFVGERVLVWISAGKRPSIVVPARLVFKRFGLDFARVAAGTATATDVVVQLGRTLPEGAAGPVVEVLSGLKAGDVLLAPEARP